MIEKHAACIKRKDAMKKGAKKYCQLPLRYWQYRVMSELMETPNDRKIIWYCDESGGCGKTWLTRACFSKFESIRFENSKSSDIKHAYNGERIVFFDLTRSQQEHFNYEAMETIKNGIMFSSKYDSRMKIFDHPHVVVMANWMPDTSKLSSDRWDVRQINNIDIECHPVKQTMDDIILPPPKKDEPEAAITMMSTCDEEEDKSKEEDVDSDCFIVDKN